MCETFDILQASNGVIGSEQIKFFTDSKYTPKKRKLHLFKGVHVRSNTKKI